MKKRFKKIISSFLLLASTLAVNACTYPEKEIKIIFYDENGIQAMNKTVGLHHDCIAPELKHVNIGHKFYGWGFTKELNNQIKESLDSDTIEIKIPQEKEIANNFDAYKINKGVKI